MCSEFVDRFGAIVGRMACLFAVAVLFCVSSAHAQVIEEGGFPVKGGDNSGESFSLSCPPRLVVEAGESVALSCSATDIPEEGVRYGWESVSGEGLRLLSDAQVLSPLFAAPLSGAGAEYAYRLTAMAAGVYRTATVTVAVEGVPGETVGAPVVREECDSFTVPDELGEGCVEDKGPAPFGFGFGSEGGFLFPEAPGLPDRPSGPVRGGGSVMQAPPRLECPAAVFLEELETSVIECRVFDASGEEHLEYVWEPVGGTTRDYLENPRLIPEDSPTPSVVAPEAPVYETLESFRSVEPTFRYRYRLTATSRATGLSSRTEVEVFVSGSRPGVYCPLEVVVEEGATIALDCEGVDPLSGRMDYDEDGASIAWEWEGLWGASTALLDATDRSSPLFTAPAGSAGEAYHYIASMTSSASGFPRTARRRVTVRVVGDEEDVSGRMNNHSLTIPGNPFTVTEWQRNVEFGVQISHTNHDGILYELGLESIDSAPHALQNIWGGGSTAITFRARTDWNNISRQAPCVYADTTWEYKVCLIEQRGSDGVSDLFDRVSSCSEAALGERAIADLSITILDTGNPACPAAPPPPPPPAVRCPDIETYEGAADITLDCTPTSEPPGATYSWTGRDIANRLSSTTELRPTFLVPEDVDSNKYYNYTITMSADGQERARGYVWIAVLDRVSIGISCAAPDPAYEGSSDITLDCTASGAPAGSTYEYVWAPRGDTPDTALLSAADIASPTFYVPDEVDEDETYEYLLTVSVANAEDATAMVTVTVLNRGSLRVACADPGSVYEGSADVAFDCTASGAAAGSSYAYSWRARGATAGTSLLSRTDIASPVFSVPDAVDEDETYEYLLTVSAANAESATAFVTVTVLKRGSLAVACTDPGAVYEGSADVAFDCSASGASSGSAYAYSWRARGATSGTSLLSRTDIASPVFYVPSSVTSDETYEYALTASARNAESATAFVTVTVLKRGSLSVACTDPDPVYEGTPDITLDCSASGAPGDDPVYTHAWTAWGGTSDTDLLSTDGPAPTFLVPDEVDSDETYEYLLTVSAANAEDASVEVTVTVLNREALALACADPGSVYEGSADITLDCSASGAPEGSDYAYAWTARGDTQDMSLLSAVDMASPTFYVPDEVSEDETYEYLLTVSADNAEDASAEVMVTVLNKGALAVVCTDPGSVYEGSEDIAFDCEASGAPGDRPQYAYAWTARGDTQDMSLLSAVDMASPTFYVPDEVSEDETYEYLLTVSADNAEDASAEVMVTVLNKGALAVVCTDPGSVYEGSEDIAFDCEASGAPGDRPQYAYAWTARGDTQDMSLLSAVDMASPTFYVPDEVSEDETYEYLLTVSADNAEDASAEVMVTVLNKGALAVVCTDPGSVYEGSEDIAFDCEASGAPGDRPQYAYAWTARGDTQDMSLLSAVDMASPTFYVPDEVSEDETYEYLLTVSADNAEDASVEVTVTVLNREALALACADPGSVYEGSADITLDCSASGAPEGSDYAYAWTASGAPEGSDYAYAWTARGDTQDMSLLSAVDMASPTFYVPDEVSEDETYEYLLTVSADNAEDASAEVMVTVLNKGALAVVCTDPGSVYEGSEDIAFDCEASGAPGDRPQYAYAWTARGDTQDMSLLSAVDMASPTFYVPDEVSEDETYEYLLTVSADNAEDASAEVTVTVLNKGALAVVCTDPGSVYEGSADITLDCSASGAPEGSDYAYAWTARGDTQDMSLLSAVDMASPTFYVPDEVSEDETYEYLLTVSADNAEDASAEVMVTVLNKGALAVVCTDPGSVYEGSEDIAFDCEASGAPGDRPQYAYAWTARGDTQDMSLLSAVDMASPTFSVPDAVDVTTDYEYLLTVSAANAEDASAEVTVTVLNKEALALACADPGSVYEGSEDIAFDCAASGAPEGSDYEYAWAARGGTADMSLLSAADNPSPTFYVPDEVSEDETYEYLLTVSAANAEDAAAEVTVTVLNKEALALSCADPGSVYEGSEDFSFDCTASGALGDDPVYTYAWTARGDTQDTSLLSATDIASPTFHVPAEVDEDETYEYLLTVSAANAEDAAAEVTVTVLNKEALALSCADPGSVYEGSEDFSFDCTASGALGDDPVYTYAWTARGDTQDTSLLSATDIASPTFHVPAEVDEDETYEYLLTVSAANAEDASAEVTVTVLDRVQTPPSDPVSRPLASSSAPESAQPSSLGVTVSASSLRFGVQSAETQASLDPMTDQLSTRVSGPYHAGRMTLSPDGGEALDKNGEMALSIELASPVVLRLEGGVDAASIVLSPSWSFAESCEQLSSQAIGGLYTETTLSEDACRLLRFGGELDLTDVLPGHYAGSLDVVLRSGEREETHSVEVDVTVVPAQRVITIGPGGVRFSTSRELSAGLSEEQNLSIYPDVAFLTREKPHGAFELSNPSLIPLEVTVSTRFGYTEATENGREVVVEEASESHLGDLSEEVDIRPGVLVLQPGEKGLVRYGIEEGALAAMEEKGYAAFFDVVSEPRQYVRTDRMPEEVSGDRTARVTMRVPGVYVPGEGASRLRATLLSISYVGSLSATFLVETEDRPFAGEVVAYDGEGRELGRRETLVYTRSRVRIPLNRIPEEDAVFLRFAPRGSGRVPEPASIEWDAPRRDIGAGSDKGRARTPETLARKP